MRALKERKLPYNVVMALRFLKVVLSILPAKRVKCSPYLGLSEAPAVVFSDAQFERDKQGRPLPARFGFLIRSPRRPTTICVTGIVPEEVIDDFTDKKQHISQLEQIVSTFCLAYFPELFVGTRAFWYFDNQAACVNCCRGYSAKTDSACISGLTSLLCMVFDAQLWWDYCPGDWNDQADGLSRLPEGDRISWPSRVKDFMGSELEFPANATASIYSIYS